MKASPITVCGWSVVAALVLCAGIYSSAQDPSGEGQSLGDAARKARQEHSAAGHLAAKQSVNEEDDGPDPGGVWRVRLCTRTPCWELSIALPKNAQWTRSADQPRPVLIPLVGNEAEPDHAIRIYSGEALAGILAPVEFAKRGFLQEWFARPEYFGQPARMLRDWHVPMNGGFGIITQFTVLGGATKYRGFSVVATSPNGSYGFACLFRDEDTSAAASICEAIVKSATSQALEPAKPHVYPTYEDPPRYEPDDQPDDPPDDGDPE
jgi:hypothetical protein